MKRLLLFFVLCFNLSTYPMNCLTGLFKEKSEPVAEQIKNAIIGSDVNSVLTLVKDDISENDLQYFQQLAKSTMGRTPKSTPRGRFIGTIKIALGMALLYKTGDYFKTEYNNSKNDILNRYRSFHNVMMDIACLSGFISSSNFLSDGFDKFNPRSNYKKQLLINLYLKSLSKV